MHFSAFAQPAPRTSCMSMVNHERDEHMLTSYDSQLRSELLQEITKLLPTIQQKVVKTMQLSQ